jgi:hypothetical protein
MDLPPHRHHFARLDPDLVAAVQPAPRTDDEFLAECFVLIEAFALWWEARKEAACTQPSP